MDKEKFIEWELIARRLKGELSEAEEQEFLRWLGEDDSHREYYEKAAQMWAEPKAGPQPDIEKLIARFDRFADRTPRRTLSTNRIYLLGYAAAVVVLLAVAGSIFLQKNMPLPEDASVTVAQGDIVPGSPRAHIVLDGGAIVDLTTSGNCELVEEEGGASIRMEHGTIAYEAVAKAEKETYNSIVIPRGGEYCLRLSDGTAVWLNSATRMRYPVSFVGGQRVVELEGEAYFEVAKDPAKPFIVRTVLSDIRVYGTSFNVSAYADEKVQHTTLAEGSVGIIRDGNEYRLEPGQQARIGDEVSICTVNVDLYCSWHKGVLMFENERLEDIMKRLSNWYDVDIRFEKDGLRNLHFTGDLERYADFTDILELIGMTTNVRFEVDGRTVMVRPGDFK